MKKNLLLSLIFCGTAFAQAPSVNSGDAVQDAAAVLGAINGVKAYAERCMSTGTISSRKDLENVWQRLGSYEALEIEMHYYIVREGMKMEQISSEATAVKIQEALRETRREYVAGFDPKALVSDCSNFVARMVNKDGDINQTHRKNLSRLRQIGSGAH